MKIDIFSEMQHPKELWGDDGQYEHRLFEQTLEQAKLADQMGYGCWWEVEHHTAVEFSFSSAPELMLTAIAQNTEQINVGHAAVLAPSRFNHAIRIAERAAFLDHLSNGRLQMGLARSTVPEWRTFNIEADSTRDQLQQTFEMVPEDVDAGQVLLEERPVRDQRCLDHPEAIPEAAPAALAGL